MQRLSLPQERVRRRHRPGLAPVLPQGVVEGTEIDTYFISTIQHSSSRCLVRQLSGIIHVPNAHINLDSPIVVHDPQQNNKEFNPTLPPRH